MTRDYRLDALIQAASEGRVSRRSFLKAAAGLGMSMPAALGLLQACAPSPTVEPQTTTPEAADTPAPQPTPAPSPTSVPKRTSAVIGLPAAVRTLDPFQIAGGSVNDMRVGVNIFDSLFDMNWTNYAMIPVLIEDWEQTDLQTWVLKLKEGVQFHKGYGEMTAEDWAWWVNTNVEDKPPTYFLMGSGTVTEAVVKDKYTVEVHLSKPWPAFPVTSLCTYGGVVFSKKAYEEMGPEEFAKNPIGTGPFELELWTPGAEVVLKRFEDYHEPGLPKLEQLVFQGVEDAVVRLEKILEGELNWTIDIQPQDIQGLRENPDLQVLDSAAWMIDYMTFNHTLLERPWLDKRVRQAISYAIDRQEVVDVIYYGGAQTADDPLCPGFLGNDPDPQYYPDTADLEKAKALMEDAGYADGFIMPCLTSEKPHLRREIQLVADQLQKIGITMHIEQVDAATFRSRNQNLEFDTILEDWGMASPDTDSALYWAYHTSPEGVTNMGADGWSNADVDRLLDEARVSMDTETRADMYREVLDVIAEECPKLFIANSERQFVMSAGLSGFEPVPIYIFPQFKNMDWTA
jgi:peptide/nickel transport system substrate-binding protein